MQGGLECEGKVRFGPLPWELSERLTQFSGNWLAYAPEENAIIVRHAQLEGCPALFAVPCELISLIDSIPSEQRDAMPGGTLLVRDRQGRVVRLTVERGEVRIQWPHMDYTEPIPVPPESVMNSLNPGAARIRGWARFAGLPDRAAELRSFADRFGGLYPEGDLPSECEQNLVFVRFKDANMEPQELLAKLQELADPPGSLEADLEVRSLMRGSPDQDFWIRIHQGRVETLRPALWNK